MLAAFVRRTAPCARLNMGVMSELSERFMRQFGVSSSGPDNERTHDEDGTGRHMLRMSGGSRMMIREDVLDFFQTHGFKLEAKDVYPQASVGYQYVMQWWLELGSSEEVKRATKYSDSFIGDSKIKLFPATVKEFEEQRTPLSDQSNGCYVYVNNIPVEASTDDIYRSVQNFILAGSNAIRLIRPSHVPPGKVPKKTALIKFATAEEAHRCVRLRHARKWHFRTKQGLQETDPNHPLFFRVLP